MARVPVVSLFALLLALPSPGGPLAQTAIPVSSVVMPEGTSEISLPFDIYRRWMVVAVQVEDSPALPFILDTGAPITVLADMVVARALPLNIVGHAEVAGIGEGESPTVPVAGGVTLRIGDLRITDAYVALGVAGEAIAGAAGIIGRPLFHNLVVEVDWTSQTLRLIDPDTFVYRGNGVAVPLRELPSGHLTTVARVAVTGEATRDLQLLVDTGAGHALSVERASIDGLGQPERLLSGVLIGWGSNGVAHGDIGRVARVELGGHVLEQVVTTFPDTRPWQRIGEALATQIDGNLGSGVMQRFKVTFDVPHGRLWLEPNGAFGDPFRFDGTGLALAPWNPGNDSILIADVVEGSPADEAGIRVGDEITAIGGREVATMGANDVQGLLEGDPGQSLVVALRRNGETFERTLTLRTLI